MRSDLTMINNVKIIEYLPEHQPWFEKFNRDWIEKYFWMEPIDFEVLQNPEEYIIKKGGTILVAYCNNEVAGTVALKYAEPGVYEFTKMAVDEKFRGQKVGQALAEAAIEKAKKLAAHKIILYSNTKLIPAVALYRKLGFIEVPVDGIYKRTDIKMELSLSKSEQKIELRLATKNDVDLLRTVAIQSFHDLLDKSNTAENMKLYIDKNFTVQQITLELNDKNNTFLLAFDNDKVIAYLKLRTGQEPDELGKAKALEIERLYCIQEYVGKQVGKLLMQTALDHATDSGYDTVWLGVWEHNPRAFAFYQKWGFEKFGSHIFLLGTDPQTDWLMKKKL